MTTTNARPPKGTGAVQGRKSVREAPDGLAAAIEREHQQAENAFALALDHALRAGRLLVADPEVIDRIPAALRARARAYEALVRDPGLAELAARLGVGAVAEREACGR